MGLEVGEVRGVGVEGCGSFLEVRLVVEGKEGGGVQV